jgi:predicted chitinase
MPVTDNNKDRERYKSISGDPNPPLDSRIDNFEDLLDAAQVDDDSLVGEIRNIRGSGEETSTPDGQESTLGKNKAKNKGTASSVGAPPDVYLDAKDRENALKTPYTEEDLIEKIKEMPDQMLPRYIKSRADMIVKSFGINTREKVANFFGQLASESIRGLAEYVYYSKKGITNLGKKMSNYREGDEDEFFYSDNNVEDGIPFGIKTPPWEKGGMFDTYYGGKYTPRTDLGNTFNKESLAKNDAGVVEPDEKINDYTVDPGFYKGSPEGYAYRGHGAIQITGKNQYERMNQFFGVNGKYEKNNVDFLEYPELVSYNWRSDLGGGRNGKDQNKFALLSALMWWNDHKGVQINEVSLGTTTTITKAVSNSESTARNRHKNVERYYDFLLGGTVAKSLYSNVNYTPNNFKPGELKTREDVPQLSGRQKSSIFGEIEYEPLDNGRVQILNNFEQDNIVFVEIPQLNKFGYNGTRFHKKGAEQLKRLWAEWQELGLLDGILTFSPAAFSPRYSKSKGSRSLSSHTWGIAFDINQRWNDLYETPAALGTKGSVRELVPSAIKWGFFWGGWWTGTPDGMHFEISRVLDPNTLKFV